MIWGCFHTRVFLPVYFLKVSFYCHEHLIKHILMLHAQQLQVFIFQELSHQRLCIYNFTHPTRE